ncbi:hypothetical protein H0H81_000127 [Sphagnurus paluster]|uniref:F-box domain-containing protein n=1 Tax=Sphagnurus paluster TaxID=117069 RepID=A0A9P7KM66_9AGAR|nr:hypothetical protein H0H81_000127 [Sphagnurus paluster]
MSRTCFEVPSKTPTPSLLLRLPVELLLEILIWYKHIVNPSSAFSHGIKDLHSEFRYPTEPLPETDNRASRAILLLGSLSLGIRNVAWATPQLWSHISITLIGESEHLKLQLAGLASWLVRSGTSSLHIRLQCSTDPSPSTDEHWSQYPPLQAVDTILPHCHLIEELCLVLPFECYIQLFQNKYAPQMRLLQRLTLFFRPKWLGNSRPTPLDLTALPALTEASLLNFPSRKLAPSLPINHISRFRVHHVGLAHALDVVRTASLLEACTLTWALGYPEAAAPVHHSRLRTLKVEGSTTPLRHLTLPALEQLYVKTRRMFVGSQCVQLIQRSGCTLSSLWISAETLRASDLIDCLVETPALRSLRVYNRFERLDSLFRGPLIQCLTLQEGETTLVPRLEHLEVLGCSCNFSVESLAMMLESRWCGGVDKGKRKQSGLGNFTLVASREASITIREDVMCSPSIRRLVEQGMIVSVQVAESK